MASLSPDSAGTNASRRAVIGALPGVQMMCVQDVGSLANTPALRNEVLPAPDGPTSANMCSRLILFHRASTSSSRPKKYSRSCSVKAARPGYGLRSSAPSTRRVSSSRALPKADAVANRCSGSRAMAFSSTGRHGESGS